MQDYIPRDITEKVNRKLRSAPATALLGPRQCGKTTLALSLIENTENVVYLDLERRSDLNKLRDPEAFFTLNAQRLICLDEIQRAPYPYRRGVNGVPLNEMVNRF